MDFGHFILIAWRALNDLEGAEWLRGAAGGQEGDDCEEDAEWLIRRRSGN